MWNWSAKIKCLQIKNKGLALIFFFLFFFFGELSFEVFEDLLFFFSFVHFVVFFRHLFGFVNHVNSWDYEQQNKDWWFNNDLIYKHKNHACYEHEKTRYHVAVMSGDMWLSPDKLSCCGVFWADSKNVFIWHCFESYSIIKGEHWKWKE